MSLPVDHSPSDTGDAVIPGRHPSRVGAIGSKIDHYLVGDYDIGQGGRRYASLLALLVAFVIGSATYVSEGWVFDREVSLLPDLVSGMMAGAIVGALYVRRILELTGTFYSVLSLVLNVSITANLIEAILGGGGWSILGLSMPYLIAFAIVLSWVGLRPLAPFVWALVVMVGFVNLRLVSEAMGFWGYLFIILAAVGIVLQLEPRLKHLRAEFRSDFMGVPSAGPAIESRAAVVERLQK